MGCNSFVLTTKGYHLALNSKCIQIDLVTENHLKLTRTQGRKNCYLALLHNRNLMKNKSPPNGEYFMVSSQDQSLPLTMWTLLPDGIPPTSCVLRWTFPRFALRIAIGLVWVNGMAATLVTVPILRNRSAARKVEGDIFQQLPLTAGLKIDCHCPCFRTKQLRTSKEEIIRAPTLTSN